MLARTITLYLLIVSFYPAAWAQRLERNEDVDLSTKVSALENTVKSLQEQDQQILSSLNEIRQLLASAVRPTPQPPSPPSALTLNNESFRGKADASVAVIEYADFECPYCGQYEHDTYPQISKAYIQTGKVKYFYRDLPLPMHPHAVIAARAARCAGEQGKYWEMHDSLFAKQNTIREADMPGRVRELGLDLAKFSECLSSDRYADELRQSAAEAQKMGIGGTPTFFIGKVDPNGEVTNLKTIIGARPYNDFKSVIDDALASKAP
jgi:protein-disulfide isomerase